MGDSTFGGALRAHLTKLVGGDDEEIKQTAENAEVNTEQGPESEATFGAKKGVAMSGTERQRDADAPASVIPAKAGNHALPVGAPALFRSGQETSDVGSAAVAQ
jgi:hypothetical protein